MSMLTNFNAYRLHKPKLLQKNYVTSNIMNIKKISHRRVNTECIEQNSAFNLLKRDHFFDYTQLPKEKNKDAVEKIINELLTVKLDQLDNDISNNNNITIPDQDFHYRKLDPINPRKTIFNEILRTDPISSTMLTIKNKRKLLGQSHDEITMIQEIKYYEKKKKYNNLLFSQPSLSDKSSTIEWMFNLSNNNQSNYLRLKQREKTEAEKTQLKHINDKIKEKQRIIEYHERKRKESAMRLQQEYRF